MSQAERLRELVAKLVNEGCSCDLLTGWHCGIHKLIDELERILAEPAEPSEQPFAYACPANCGCIWRDNKDGTMSLFGKRSQSCEVCEPLPLAKLVPLWREILAEPTHEKWPTVRNVSELPPVAGLPWMPLEHTRSCSALTPGNEEDCTCGLRWRIQLQTEREMHNAWRKRAEEAEAAHPPVEEIEVSYRDGTVEHYPKPLAEPEPPVIVITAGQLRDLYKAADTHKHEVGCWDREGPDCGKGTDSHEHFQRFADSVNKLLAAQPPVRGGAEAREIGIIAAKQVLSAIQDRLDEIKKELAEGEENVR